MTWKRNLEIINDDSPLYNSRILKSYVDYLRTHHPDADIDTILSYARISHHDLDDVGHWFSQKQTDRFQEMLVTQTGRVDIPRKAGRHAALPV